MNKSFIAVAAMFCLILMSTAASAVTPTLSVVSGKVMDGDSNPVNGANVDVTCTHNGTETMKSSTTGSDGTYKVVFPVANCAVGDNVHMDVTKGDASGSGNGTVSNTGDCIVDTAIVDITIPEFTVIGATLALVGTIAGFAVMRKRN
jgi:hypothetical protein